MDQYSELHSTAHALMEEAADARVLALRLEDGIAQLGSVQTRQERLAKDLQHLVIGTRMTAAGVLESRLQRNVRSTCQATGKQAVLVLKGGDTQIDSDVLNRLTEPLLHLLRNAVDHGLESPAERARRRQGRGRAHRAGVLAPGPAGGAALHATTAAAWTWRRSAAAPWSAAWSAAGRSRWPTTRSRA